MCVCVCVCVCVILYGLPCWLRYKESACNSGNHVGFLGWEDLWRRKCLSTPLFLPGELHGQRSLAGYSSLGHKELDMIE